MRVRALIEYFTPPILIDLVRLLLQKSRCKTATETSSLDPLDVLEKHAGDAIAFVPSAWLQPALFYYEQMKELREVPGDIVEFGVYRGSMLSYLCHISEFFDHPLSSRQIIGFDTFTGYPESNEVSSRRDAFRDTSKEIVLRKLKGRDMRRVTLVEGDIFETLPRHLRSWPNKICMAILDVDTAKPTRFILEQIWDRMSPGGRIYFDEYSKDGWTETLGVDEFLESRGVPISVVKHCGRKPSGWIQL